MPEHQRELVVRQMYAALDSYQRTWTSRPIKRDWKKDIQRVSANMLNRPDYFIKKEEKRGAKAQRHRGKKKKEEREERICHEGHEEHEVRGREEEE